MTPDKALQQDDVDDLLAHALPLAFCRHTPQGGGLAPGSAGSASLEWQRLLKHGMTCLRP